MKSSTRITVGLTVSLLAAITLSGCNAEEVAQAAADAAACRAGQSAIAEIQSAYEAGLVDSGVLTLVDSLIGDQVDALLSSELAGLFGELKDVVSANTPVDEAATKVSAINADIAARCSEVGVDFSAE